MTKRKEDVPQTHEHPHNCITCKHWVSKGELEKRDYVDFFSGRCQKSGVQCGPAWTCKDWGYGRMKIEPKYYD